MGVDSTLIRIGLDPTGRSSLCSGSPCPQSPPCTPHLPTTLFSFLYHATVSNEHLGQSSQALANCVVVKERCPHCLKQLLSMPYSGITQQLPCTKTQEQLGGAAHVHREVHWGMTLVT